MYLHIILGIPDIIKKFIMFSLFCKLYDMKRIVSVISRDNYIVHS